MKMFTNVILALVASVAAVSNAMDSSSHSSPDISVVISHAGSTRIKAAMTNNGDKGYNILSSDTFLDNQPVDKATVTIDGAKVPTIGFKVFYMKTDVDPSRFVALNAGQTYEVEFDLAETHMFHNSSHGRHEVVAQGLFLYADLNSTQLLGQVPYTSNRISVDFDVREAVAAFDALNDQSVLSKRTTISRDHCSSAQGAAIGAALRTCTQQASAAANVARGGRARVFRKWFSNVSRSVTIGNRLNWISQSCASTNGNRIQIYCRDPGGFGNTPCLGNVIALARQDTQQILLCPQYFSDPQTTNNCNNIAVSQTGTLIHEFLHLEPSGCEDLSFTASGSQALAPEQQWRNCESYTLFAGEVAASCSA
jgi:deuterolysin